MKTSTTLATALFFICSCNPDQEQKPPSLAPTVVEARGYVVPKDSMEEPKVVPVGKPKIIRAGKPKVVPVNSNVHPVGKAKVVTAGIPRVCTPGEGGCALPKSVPAVGRSFIAGIPEVVVAKDAYAKDQNPHNFSSFGKLQGLKSDGIYSLMEDKNGNLWISVLGAGVTRYDGKSFTHFSVKEGLFDNVVYCMLADRAGNLWFGGLTKGVCRYDGQRFTHFTTKEGIPNTVWKMVEDSEGKLWFGSHEGVTSYDGNSFTHFGEKEGMSNKGVLSMMNDKMGNLWFGTHGDGVVKYDHKTFTYFTEKEGLSDSLVTSIYEDKHGNLWFGTRGGVTRYDQKTFTHYTVKEGMPANTITTIQEDKHGHLWFGSPYGGVSKFDGKNFTWFREREGLPDNRVTSMLKDKRGNLWFGTDRAGISKYGGELFTHYTVNEGLSDDFIRSIFEDNDGNIWFGTWRGGVNKYDGRSFTQITYEQGLGNHAVTSMMQDRNGHFWFGGYLGLTRYDGRTFKHFTEQQGLSGKDVFSILEDNSGNVWIGTRETGVNKYDGTNFTHFTQKEGLSNNNVYNILQDKRGDLWFGTHGGGLTRYGKEGFIHFSEKEGLKDNDVKSIFLDKSGNLWIGSLTGGVSIYDGKRFIHFTEEQGLSNNEVISIFQDRTGNLWFGTASGLSKLGKNTLDSLNLAIRYGTFSALMKSGSLFKTYVHENAFSGNSIGLGQRIHEAKDGTIWIGTDERLTAFHPEAETTDTIPPNIQLTGLALFNEKIAWQNLDQKSDTNIVLGNGMMVHDFHFDTISRWYGLPQHLSLAYNNNYLTFHFVGITLQSPKKVKYQFMLEGFDKRWSSLTDRTEAQYGNLPHGKYTFKVKAMNGDGYWSNEFHYSFTIRPPWWHTWWAYTLFVLLLAGLIYALFRYRINKIRLQHEVVLQKHKAAELEMQALRSQMNPHFIFNSLNSINLFILENNKLQASEYLSKFSRLVRLILNNSQESFIPLEKELEALRLYLELESLRFEQRFNYQITVEESVDTTLLKVPPLVIQPYAENAIWHGLMHKKDAGHLEIQLYQQGEILFCRITDDGVGRKTAAQLESKSAAKSVGMRITADRIAMLQDSRENNAYVTVTDLVLPDGTPGGTEVLVRIPVLS